MLNPYSTSSQLNQTKGSLTPSSPSCKGETTAADKQEPGFSPNAGRPSSCQSSRLRQRLGLAVALGAVLGVVVWFQLASVMMSSAVSLIHMQDHLRSHSGADRTTNLTAATEVLQNSSLHVHGSTPAAVLLFDDRAKLAIKAQKRREATARAQKEQARLKGVSLEWQRHHHLDGSVYAKLSAD